MISDLRELRKIANDTFRILIPLTETSQSYKLAKEFFGEIEKRYSILPEYNHVEKGLISYWGLLGTFDMTSARLLYILCRWIKPEIVVETGVASGMSSAHILYALERNKKGCLYSIDFPPRTCRSHMRDEKILHGLQQDIVTLPQDKAVGWLVPTKMRRRWVIRFGKSRDLLSHLLEDLGSIDIFLHDSDHSYRNMSFEFDLAWNHLRQGGLLISDDVHRNTAFSDFVKSRKKNSKHLIALERVGIMQKLI
jgi:predicted O-methyltransferase YrrM